MKKILSVFFLFQAMAFSYAGKLVTYTAPKGAPLSNSYKVEVRLPSGKWKVVPVYQWRVDRTEKGFHHVEKTSVASFDFIGTVEVKITPLHSYKVVRIRPLSYNIFSEKNGKTVIFRLDRPRFLSIEFDRDIFHNLHLFANGIQPKVRRGRNVIYFGPGYYDLKKDSILVSSGKTLFIDGGAYIKGWISVWKARHARVVGHGFVNPESPHEGIMVRYSQDVRVEGPVSTQIPVGGSDSVSISDAKVMSWYGWGDGMNVFASNHIKYNHVFCRSSDDCSTIYATRKNYYGGCQDIQVHDAVYWADVAHPIMIGLHGDVEKHNVIQDVLYDNIDILDQAEGQIDYQGCIGINDGDNNLIRNITFQNIRIEDIRQGMLFNIRVCYNKKYCHAPGMGIENVSFRNVSYRGIHAGMSVIAGYDENRNVKNISFENLNINGRLISDDMSGKPKWYKTADMADIFVGEHVNNIQFLKK